MRPLAITDCLTDAEQVESVFAENRNGLLMLEPWMKENRANYPALYTDYVMLKTRARFVELQMVRIRQLREQFNPFHLCDLATALAASAWIWDAFVLSRKIEALQ